MKTEDRVRSMMTNLDPPEQATEVEWQTFVLATRRERRRRTARGACTAAVVGAILFVALFVSGSFLDSKPLPSISLRGPGFGGLDEGWTTLAPPDQVITEPAIATSDSALFLWGGYLYTGNSDEEPSASGSLFDQATGEWHRLPDSPLDARIDPASVWTGDEFLVWGGSDMGEGSRAAGRPLAPVTRFFDDGAAYDPSTGAWRELPPSPASGRAPMSVWTGSEMLVWGTAERVPNPPRDGAAYDPVTNTWRRIASAPIELTDATAVWTGEEMVVFGASLQGGNHSKTDTAIGAAYDPATDSWRRLPDSTLSPQASTAAWNGHEVIAWDYLLDAQAYSPATNEWRELPRVPLGNSECSPRSIVVGATVVGDYCGDLVEYDAQGGWTDLGGRGGLLVGAGPVAIVMYESDEGPQMRAYRPSNSLDSPNDENRVVSVTPQTVRVGETVTLGIYRSPGVWGLAWPLERREDDRWVEVGSLNAGPGRAWRPHWSLDRRGIVTPTIGFGGTAMIRIKIPALEPGSYRLVRDFIKNGPGSVAQRTRTFYAEFEIVD
jgi:hypothetical protein